jgi:thiol-disulfide isomerase/thioredoxin
MLLRPKRMAVYLCLLAALLAAPVIAGAWTLQDSTGKTLGPATYPGQWVLVNFWATWCTDCAQEIPQLIRLQHDKVGTLAIIGVAVDYRDPQVVLNYARQEGIDYPIVLGNEDTAAEFGGIRGLPESFLYAPDGALVRRFPGPVTETMIEDILKHSTARL